ncbi:unnamed protein product [Urochloa humidicola]
MRKGCGTNLRAIILPETSIIKVGASDDHGNHKKFFIRFRRSMKCYEIQGMIKIPSTVLLAIFQSFLISLALLSDLIVLPFVLYEFVYIKLYNTGARFHH